MYKISQITIYPIKALNGICIKSSQITAGGALIHDREFALFNEDGDYITAETCPKILHIQATYDLTKQIISLKTSNQKGVFHWLYDRSDLESFFSEYFGFRVAIRRNQVIGFPYNSEHAGPTLISTGTLRQVQSWFPQYDLESIRRRFRINIEVESPIPFWEEQFSAEGRSHKFFRIGKVLLRGRKINRRKDSPSYNPLTGKHDANFLPYFVQKRSETLPNSLKKRGENRYFYLGIHTNIDIDQMEKNISLGDKVQPIFE